ncbi:UPF0246 protein [Amylibacter ulvae]|uniref:UPF0246 protein GCM10008927_26250 n=1 Tax=Paramylibacter ulvae TaxID=1651968 RepID=A0ABQ3D604_9RHOB|nr:peroxide stress protein YaaA [Amylibacter ulvae]GHA59448.1 UPF0246 protein [Amylibacter ulvae]
MLAVISPAKKMNFDALEKPIPDSNPQFQSDANVLVKVAKKLSVSELRAMMKISEDLAKLNRERFQAFKDAPTDLETKQAAFAFAGDTYTGLQSESLSDDDLAYAQDHLRILSGLYGMLRPLDRIQPYRLEMGRKLQTKSGGTLYAYWGDRIGQALDTAANGSAIINLASHEYFKAAGKHMKSTVITPAFKEERDGGLKMIGLFAKKARGSMARYIVQNRIETLDTLKSFDTDGYKFNAELSGETDWVFTRKTP